MRAVAFKSTDTSGEYSQICEHQKTFIYLQHSNDYITDTPQDMIANNLTPFEPTHPGELIKDELEFRNITQAKLAESISVSPSLINEIIKGKRGVNTEMALLLEAALNIPADLLLKLQSEYNMQVAKADDSLMKRLSSIRKIAALL